MNVTEVEKYYKQFSQDVFNVAFYYTFTKEDAEDVLMEVFAALLEHEPKNRDNIKSYLLRSAMNKAIDLKRRNHATSSISLDDEEIPEPFKNENDAFFDLVRGLSPRYKAPIVLFYVSDYSVVEISLCLGISISAAKKRLERGRELIRRKLEHEAR